MSIWHCSVFRYPLVESVLLDDSSCASVPHEDVHGVLGCAGVGQRRIAQGRPILDPLDSKCGATPLTI